VSASEKAPAGSPISFRDLGLPESLIQVLTEVGYESPSPIQAATIPLLLAGRDLLGQAQTGTGKTAAFALPILARVDLSQARTQALVLTPTRELAIQVAEAFQRYAAHLRDFHVLPIYGGQGYGPQLAALRRGVHVVVGTPGRIIDHLERGSLNLQHVRHVVLDEADEMLRMGFIDAVEGILEKAPKQRQTALFSATMPAPIRRIAQKHLSDPAEIEIKSKTRTAANVRQRFWMVSGLHKLDALTRILEAEPFEAMIVFTRTKQATEELAEKLQARGFSAAAINGDIPQPLRERCIQKLKDGQLDILVATDVAARGLDVDRVSHVFNYDVPYDTESYVHRIGRTGRAGRSGEAILFIAPRERHLLQAIERATRQTIEPMELPSIAAVNDQRVARFKQKLGDAINAEGVGEFRALIEQYEREQNVPAIEIAAALARVLQGDEPLLLAEPVRGAHSERVERKAREDRPARPAAREKGRPFAADARPERAERPARAERAPRGEAAGPRAGATGQRPDTTPRPRPERREADALLETYRLEVGQRHQVRPGQIVGAVANEAGLDGSDIGRIDILDDYTLIDLPKDMPKEIFRHLQKVRVAGRPLRISPWDGTGPRPRGPTSRK
jgi:ATP-dependent RNA helicase DeaD